MTEPAPATPTVTALILAGQRPGGDSLTATSEIDLKALLPVGGRPMLGRVIEALEDARGVGRIAVSIPAPEAIAGYAVDALATAETPSLSVLEAIDRLPTPLLVTTADHPLLTAEIVERFQAAAAATDADVVVGLVERASIEALAIETSRTYWRFNDGAFSGANLFYLRNPRARAAISFWRQVEQDRKKPWRIVQALGPALLSGYLFGRLGLDEALERASARLGCRVQAVVLPFGEAAIDVDKPADLELVERLLARREALATSPPVTPSVTPAAS